MMTFPRRWPWRKIAAGGAPAVLVLAGVAIWFLGSDEEWARTRRALEAKGETFRLEDFLPPPVAEELNFGALPILNPAGLGRDQTRWMEETLDGGGNHPGAKLYAEELAIPWKTGSNHSDSQPFLTYARGRADWPALKQALVDAWPEIAPISPPVEAVLRGLEHWRAQRDELVQGLTRPEARSTGNPRLIMEHETFTNDLRGSGQLRLAEIIQLHALASLDAGRTPEALEDVRILMRLRDVWDNSLPIGGLASPIFESSAVNAVWYGLVGQRWSGPERAQLTELFAHRNPIAEAVAHVTLYRQFIITAMSRDARQYGWLAFDPNAPWSSRIFARTPAGLAAIKSEVSLGASQVLGTMDGPHRTVDFAARQALVKALRPYEEIDGVRAMSGYIGLEMTNGYVVIGARLLTWENLALTALALEDYREARGSYPATLAELETWRGSPSPMDVYSRAPLHYLPDPGGRPTLYSVGPDGIDQHGTVVARPDSEPGDYVWTYDPAREYKRPEPNPPRRRSVKAP